MERMRLTELRLTSFKTFKDQVLPLGPFTVLAGLNSSGKSNALEGLIALKRLTWAEDVRTALDSGEDVDGPIRGGLRGSCPGSTTSIGLGLGAHHSSSVDVSYDLGVRGQPVPQMLYERLVLGAPGVDSWVHLIERDEEDRPRRSMKRPGGELVELDFPVWLADRPSLVPGGIHNAVIPGDPRASLDWAGALGHLLSAISYIDPTPNEMRQYSDANDYWLTPSGRTIASAILRLQSSQPEALEEINAFVTTITGLREVQVEPVQTKLGDAGLGLREYSTGGVRQTPVRDLSSGLLRSLAIVTHIVATARGLSVNLRTENLSDPGQVDPVPLLVIEEIEDGLHPSQAILLLDLIREATASGKVQVLFTTHSPAILDALSADEHENVVLASRDEDGWSRLTRLTESQGYVNAVTGGGLGAIVTRDPKSLMTEPKRDWSRLDAIFGLG